MSQIVRQNNLFSAEDWQTIYRTFSQADFKAYDYDSIRNSMLNYIQINYPEDFNDYIASSEFIAIIDLLAFLGQSLAFRTDLNSRENFLDTAERRDSIIRLTKLINYRPKRNVPARGLLKITKIKTNEPLQDSSGNELTNAYVNWNDINNADWYDQWLTICNSIFNSTNKFGTPNKSATLNSIKTEIYSLNSTSTQSAVKNFSETIDGVNTSIDVVKADIHKSGYLYETAPDMTEAFNFIYRNDNQGFNSVDTGFFMYFKEGELGFQDYTFSNPLPNRVVDIDVADVNDTDVWVQKINTNGVPTEKWQSVPGLFGQNTIYNSLALNTRNIYAVQSRNSDQVSVLFSDGNFGNAPKGSFRIYYRTSNGQGQVLKKDRIKNKEIAVKYKNSIGQEYTATISLTLSSTVSNSQAAETDTDIKNNAPKSFYTQDRMVNAEDYNIFPLTQSTTIQKMKALNKTHIGHSRYIDINDPTGTVKSVNVFGEDGVLYKNPNFTLSTEEITGTIVDTTSYTYIIDNVLAPLIKKIQLQNFYFDTYKTAIESGHDANQFIMNLAAQKILWQPFAVAGKSSTGFFYIGNTPITNTGRPNEAQLITVYNNPNGSDEKLGFIRPGTKLEFVDDYTTPTTTTWATVVSISNDGTVLSNETTGSIVLDQSITAGLKVRKILPNLRTKLNTSETSLIQTEMEKGVDFGIGYHYRDASTKAEKWYLISEDYIDLTNDFGITKNQSHGGATTLAADTSWLIHANYIPAADSASNPKYEFKIRGLDYVFESDQEVRFYYVPEYKNIDSATGKAVKDTIELLDINKDVAVLSNPSSTTKLTEKITFSVSDSYVEADGFVDTKKIKLTNMDTDNDGMPDNPIAHENVINNTNNIFFISYDDYDGYTYYKTTTGVSAVSSLTNSGLEYLTSDNFFYLNGTKLTNGTASSYTTRYGVSGTTIYKSFIGRAFNTTNKFYFQYRHSAPRDQRIDPSVSNIMELIVLQTEYYTNVINWHSAGGTLSNFPLAPTSQEIKNNLTELEKYKSISDQLVYTSASFKLLFGTTADEVNQAIFRVVKMPGSSYTDNQVKTEVVKAISSYFRITNWDFGDTFYYSELAAYIHRQLSTQISSVVIVPKDAEAKFGDLFQIKAASNELFFSTASVDDVEIVSGLTGANLRSTGGN
tara:strand:- start:17248 stop:20724 length:3477 start_codon:yes stop_codon:yes gene_type:complete